MDPPPMHYIKIDRMYLSRATIALFVALCTLVPLTLGPNRAHSNRYIYSGHTAIYDDVLSQFHNSFRGFSFGTEMRPGIMERVD
jgi:hypothetical protein